MSTIDCGACNELRNYAPNFVQNGVDDTVAASLKNNTGLNPAVVVNHTNCEDLQDVNDCLVGRMTDELEAYDVCDWKDFMKKYGSNLYETLKAMIMNDCGLWTALCAAVETFITFARKEIPHAQRIPGTWEPLGYDSLHPAYPETHLKSNFRIGLIIGTSSYANCYGGLSCQGAFRVAIWYDGDPYPYTQPSYSMNDFSVGDIWGTVRKSDFVPAYFTEDQWKRTLANHSPLIFGTTSYFMSIVALRGYTVINGIEYNTDLKSYGEDTGVIQVQGLIGATGPVSGIGYVNIDSIKIFSC